MTEMSKEYAFYALGIFLDGMIKMVSSGGKLLNVGYSMIHAQLLMCIQFPSGILAQ